MGTLYFAETRPHPVAPGARAWAGWSRVSGGGIPSEPQSRLDRFQPTVMGCEAEPFGIDTPQSLLTMPANLHGETNRHHGEEKAD